MEAIFVLVLLGCVRKGAQSCSRSISLQADQSSSLYWRLVDNLAAEGAGSGDNCWFSLYQRASTGLSEAEARVLYLSLAARQQSPRVELYRQLAQQVTADPPCCLVQVGSVVVTEGEGLDQAVIRALKDGYVSC